MAGYPDRKKITMTSSRTKSLINPKIEIEHTWEDERPDQPPQEGQLQPKNQTPDEISGDMKNLGAVNVVGEADNVVGDALKSLSFKLMCYGAWIPKPIRWMFLYLLVSVLIGIVLPGTTILFCRRDNDLGIVALFIILVVHVFMAIISLFFVSRHVREDDITKFLFFYGLNNRLLSFKTSYIEKVNVSNTKNLNFYFI